MSDIVEKVAAVWDRMALEAELAQASAKMVEQAAEIERLRAALREIASVSIAQSDRQAWAFCQAKSRAVLEEHP